MGCVGGGWRACGKGRCLEKRRGQRKRHQGGGCEDEAERLVQWHTSPSVCNGHWLFGMPSY